jgi:hypothetical protein
MLQWTIDRCKLPPAKYSCVRYFRNVDGLFSIGVCGCTPEYLLAAAAFVILLQIYLAIFVFCKLG